MTTLLLARHGQTDWNLEHRWQGDPPLNDSGRSQARVLARSLIANPFDRVYSSDLLRTRQTAEILGEELGLDFEIDPRLREIDVGEWVGLTSPEVKERYPEGFARYLAGSAGWEQGESYATMVTRASTALHSIAALNPNGHVLVVTHAGVLCSAWLAGGKSITDWQGTYNCDVHEVVVENGDLQWIGSVQREDQRGEGKPSIFWRV